MEQHKFTNDLINETSPYLLQHAHNPVDWKPWTEATLQEAQLANKPIIVSIGYSACHWCHVMEHESFEDEEVAALMNERFVCIKVDREERPDVDQLYMSAVQLMTQRGGWPLNAITLPDGRPFWGGTYFPKENWVSILTQISDLYRNDRNKVEEYAISLSNGIKENALINRTVVSKEIRDVFISKGVDKWKQQLDYDMGGNAGSPKFMIPNNLQFLMEYSHRNSDTELEKYVFNTLEKMALGGLYDQIGGGFSRYSTDKIWKVPHFEKMLYDNAQLISLYSQIYRKNKQPLFKSVVTESIAFVEREIMSDEQVFYSALDADSEGVEGKFYVWKKEELEVLLGEDYDLFSTIYNINSLGLWEDGNYVLHRTKTNTEIAKDLKLTEAFLASKIRSFQTLLLKKRAERIRPGLDDKSLTSWNAMMGEALLEAYISFDNTHYLDMAVNNAKAIEKFMVNEQGDLFHSYKNGITKINGFLEDYAFVISFYLRLFEVGSDKIWLDKARLLIEKTMLKFSDDQSDFFWFSSHESHLPVSRQQEIHDNVIASSNSVMAHNLFRAGHLLGNTHYVKRSIVMTEKALTNFQNYPSAYSNWVRLALYQKEFYEVVVVGEKATQMIYKLNQQYVPNVVYCGAKKDDLFLTESRFKKGKTFIYVCVNNSCQLPTEDVNKAIELLNK